MENSNSREYLEKITAAVIDNLRQTGPAPSVQMQDVPRKPFGGLTDEEEAELDDMDEDENKDVRMTEHRWDKQVENGAEFEPSDDDEMASAHGATRLNGNKRSFNDSKKTEGDEKESVDQEEQETGTETPKEKEDARNQEVAEPETHDVNDDTIEDVGATEGQEKDTVEADKDVQQTEDQKVDADGDVGMEDSNGPDETTIKKEEGEPEPVAETVDEPVTSTEEKAPEAQPEKAAEGEGNSESKTEEPAADEKAETSAGSPPRSLRSRLRKSRLRRKRKRHPYKRKHKRKHSRRHSQKEKLWKLMRRKRLTTRPIKKTLPSRLIRRTGRTGVFEHTGWLLFVVIFTAETPQLVLF